MKRTSSHFFLVCEGLSNDDVGVAMGTLFQEVRPWAAFKTDDFVKGKSGRLPWNDSLITCT